jgi:hypothetical protein
MDATKTQTEAPSEQTKKRKANDIFTLSADADIDTSFSKFLVISASNSEPIKHSIFAIQKLLKSTVGDVASAKKLANGSILVEVLSKHQEKNALNMKMWIDTPVTVTPHRSLNFSRGVIRNRDFRDCGDAEVLDALRGQGVTDVKHISTKRNGVITPTNTFILTFKTATLPKFVKAAYMNIPVELYIPNPLRCFNCQKFGHGKFNCKQKAVCAKCGQEGHEDTSCLNPVHCANCSGNHAAFSKECPTWSKQRDITQIKFERNISFHEARQIVEKQAHNNSAANGVPSAKQPGVSYAKAASTRVSTTSTQTISTQTELTWPLESKVPIAVSNVVPQKAASSCHSQTETAEPSTKRASGGTKPTLPDQPPSRGKLVRPGPASKTTGNRCPKGSNDPVSRYNRFGALEDDDMDCGDPRPKSVSPRSRKKSA